MIKQDLSVYPVFEQKKSKGSFFTSSIKNPHYEIMMRCGMFESGNEISKSYYGLPSIVPIYTASLQQFICAFKKINILSYNWNKSHPNSLFNKNGTYIHAAIIIIDSVGFLLSPYGYQEAMKIVTKTCDTLTAKSYEPVSKLPFNPCE